MTLVNSVVWIDDFRGTATPQVDMLDALLDTEPMATGDLIFTELLQGFGSGRDSNQARKLLPSLAVVDLVGQDVAIEATRNFRLPRAQGITVCMTIDTLIATRCTESRLSLLYIDRVLDPFVEYLDLRPAMPGA